MILCECFRIQVRLVPVPVGLVALRIALSAPVAGVGMSSSICARVRRRWRANGDSLAIWVRRAAGTRPRLRFAGSGIAARSLGDRFDGGAIATEVAAKLFATVFRDECFIHPLGQSTVANASKTREKVASKGRFLLAQQEATDTPRGAFCGQSLD